MRNKYKINWITKLIRLLKIIYFFITFDNYNIDDDIWTMKETNDKELREIEKINNKLKNFLWKSLIISFIETATYYYNINVDMASLIVIIILVNKTVDFIRGDNNMDMDIKPTHVFDKKEGADENKKNIFYEDTMPTRILNEDEYEDEDENNKDIFDGL